MALYVVTGPPAAGKTTYVATHARPGDVVIDYDRIAQALTAGTGDTHRHPDAVQRVAHRARTAAIREGLKLSRGADVWVVHSRPAPDTLAEYMAHDAKVITIDPGKDVVLARCAEQRTPGARAAAMRWYTQHARTPQTSDTSASTVAGSREW